VDKTNKEENNLIVAKSLTSLVLFRIFEKTKRRKARWDIQISRHKDVLSNIYFHIYKNKNGRRSAL